MTEMKRLFLAAILAIAGLGQANAASSIPTAYVVATCGALAGTSVYKAGDYAPVVQDIYGTLCTAASGGGGLSIQDNTAFTYGTTHFTPMGGVYNSSITACTSGNQCAWALNASRYGYVTSAAGAIIDITNGTDTAYAGSGSTSLNGYLKGIYNAATGPIPAQTPSATTGIGSVSVDPCNYATKTSIPINNNATTSTQLIGLSGSTKIYVCSLAIVAGGATTVAFTTGTGSACVTGNTALIGSTTANIANSMSFAANGGMTFGNGGSTVAVTGAGGELCMINGSAQYVSGSLSYVQQ
jgi:hypothetical protein